MEFYYLQIIFILMKRAKLLGAKSLGGLLAKTFLGSPETLFLRFHCARQNGKITSTPEQVVSSETNPKFSSAKLILTSCVSFGLGY